jgi:hypothetical protein
MGDRRKCQTFTASPAEPGGLPVMLGPRYPQHIHSVSTGPILGMRERPHGLVAHPFTEGTKNPPA